MEDMTYQKLDKTDLPAARPTVRRKTPEGQKPI